MLNLRFRALPRSLALLTLLASALVGCSKSTTSDADASITFDASMPDAAADTSPPGDAATDAGGPTDIGTPCASASDCASGLCIGVDSGYRDGYCTADCTVTDCPDGSTCLGTGGGMSNCFSVCDPVASGRACRAGYGCGSSFMLPSPVCIPGCVEDSDCDAGLTCDPTGGGYGEGTCYNASASVGDACMTTTDCPAGASCRTEARNGFPGGTCAVSGCDLATNSGCPDGTACVSDGFRGRCFASCASSDDCRAAYACRADATYPDRSTCQAACASDSDCSGGRTCNPAAGTCSAPFDATQLGTVCAMMFRACAGGTCFTEANGYPGSSCVYQGCGPSVDDASDGCPGNGVCANDGRRDICYPLCASDSECRPGYACLPGAGGATACQPACTDDAQCTTTGYGCNLATGQCQIAFDTARLGEPCVSGGDCPGGECLDEASTGWPARACFPSGCRLSGRGPDSPCASGSVCTDDGDANPELGVCAPACASSGVCRPGYDCLAASSGSSDTVCRPACSADTDCAGGRTCQASGLCE